MAYQTPTPLRVALLCGGASSERAVSLASAEVVRAILASSGHAVVTIDTGTRDFIRDIACSDADVAFVALHGVGGEDGCIQGVLETLGLPYTGSGVLASALAMDKYRSKQLYRHAGLRAPDDVLLCRRDGVRRAQAAVLAAVGIPCVIKPVCEGSSVGISLVRDAAELTRALAQCFAVCDTALAETLIEGTEVTASVIGLDELSVLPIIEIIANAGEFYDYESKYTEGGSTHIIPARVSERAAAAVREAALCAHRVLGASGVSRTDMFVDKNDAVWLIETNTIPGMTPTSLLPDAARAAGIEVAELYDRLMFWAIERADAAKEVACGARASGLGESARVGEPAAAAGAGEKKRAGEPAAVAGPAAESERARAGEPLVSGERTHPAAPANPSGRTNAKEQQCTT